MLKLFLNFRTYEDELAYKIAVDLKQQEKEALRVQVKREIELRKAAEEEEEKRGLI